MPPSAGASLPESLDLDGVYQLESAVDGSKVLDIYAASTAEDAKVQVWGKNGSLAQKWEVTELEDGTHTIRNANSGRYLTQSRRQPRQLLLACRRIPLARLRGTGAATSSRTQLPSGPLR